MAFSIQPSPEIWHRSDFAFLCFWRKLYRCVEVGVDRGEFAITFLDRFPQCSQFWGVDDYEPYLEMPFAREADYLMAVTRLERHASRAKLIRMGSTEAATLFPSESVDFIYIDGAHDYENVRADLEAWWPALSHQAILAGHDWTEHPLHEGVKRAVTEFARRHNLKVYLTSVEGYGQEECPSWYIYRSGMPGPDWKRC